MKKIALSLFLFIGVSIFGIAQTISDQTLMTIAGRNISLGEFERIYNKNNNDNVVEKQSVEEYLDMFINFKLKVIEAEELGMDTAQSFLDEFNSYKKQLAKPYMTNPEITEAYAKEAYDRMQEEVNASHIMIRLDENPMPEDTLRAYEKLMEIRDRAINGENFESLARAASDDPSAKSNGGNLGWFSAFRMVYNFETAAYNTPVGEISMPIKSRFGMHIIKVHEKRPALGSVRIAHIFIRAPESMTKEEALQSRKKALAIVDSLKAGADFARLAMNNSDDQSSARNGGEIPWIQSGQMIPVFDKAAFALKNAGDYSDAVQSTYGWHIIKLLEKKPIGTYEDEKADIYDKMKSGERATLQRESFIKSLKKEYGYQLNETVYRKVIDRVDTTLVTGSWDQKKMDDIKNEIFFTIGNSQVKVGEFAEYLIKSLRNNANLPAKTMAANAYVSFENQKILEFEENNLENKYEDFSNILQEYHDGILLFDLTDKTVWSKAVQDTVGLEAFYEKNKENYKWENRVGAYIVTVKDSSLIDDVRKLSKKLIKKKKFSEEALMSAFCAKDTTNNCLEISFDRYEKKDNQNVDATGWKKGMGQIYYSNDQPSFVVIKEILKPSVKELSDTRGQVTADYQKYLEDIWIQQLRNKYEIKVNKDLLKQIK